jgi:hypothetical protein
MGLQGLSLEMEAELCMATGALMEAAAARADLGLAWRGVIVVVAMCAWLCSMLLLVPEYWYMCVSCALSAWLDCLS